MSSVINQWVDRELNKIKEGQEGKNLKSEHLQIYKFYR